MPVRADELLPLADHLAPRRYGRIDADADERQGGLGEDRLGNAERHRYHDRRQRVGQDVAQQQPPAAHAEPAGGIHELLLLEGEDLRPRLPRDADPAGEPDGDEDVEEAGPQHRHDQDDEQQARERIHDIDDAHDDHVGAAPQIARQGADGDAEGHDDDMRNEAEQHVHTVAEDYEREQGG